MTPSTVLGKVQNGALYFDSTSAWLKALAPFEGKAVEVTVRHVFKRTPAVGCDSDCYRNHPCVCGDPACRPEGPA